MDEYFEVLNNQSQTAIDVCTGEVERCESRKVAAQIAINNGYSIPQRRPRKALEAFWIAARNPKMNNRNECLSITSDFLPYISLCEL
ncbi:hypothetical protein Aduo_002329 [Ancylostoma duodenale]